MAGPSYPVQLLCAAMGYGLLACACTWPLPLHLQTHLLGSPGGDTGVYVWNLWIFGHELLGHGHLPVSTEHVFAYTGGADFSLHNYTPIAGLLAMPLIGMLGIVGSFNVVLLASVASSGLAMFVLGRRLGLSPISAWLAGAVFMAAPAFTARETVHLSLVMAAPLPLFLWALVRTLESKRTKDALFTGFFVAVATYCDAYFGVYCALMGAFLIAWRFGSISILRPAAGTPAVARVVDVLIAVATLLIAWRLLTGATDILLGSLRIQLQTLYNPILAITCLLAIRVWLTWRPAIRIHDDAGEWRSLWRLGLASVGLCLALLSPLLAGILLRFTSGRLPGTEIFWRSSPRGVDLLAYLVPNQNHPWFGASTRSWLIPDRADAFPELIASFSIVALLIIAATARRHPLPRLWVAFTGFFLVLSLGPFVHIGGVNTYVIGPWALLRFVPVIGMARSPSRFALLASLGLSLLFAFTVEALRARRDRPRLIGAGVLGAALVLELLPVPRPLYSAAVPQVYQSIAATSDESGRLLELPSGIRDGTSSLGNFNPASPFFQTRHRRPLIGGYLSRVSRARKDLQGRTPMLRAIYEFSEGRIPPAEWIEAARAGRELFLRRSCVRFVVLDKAKASPELRAFAVMALQLSEILEDSDYELFQPIDPPPCDPPRVPARLDSPR